MTNPDKAKPKRRGRLIVWLVGVVLVLLLGWSAFWAVGANWLGKQVKEEVAALRQHGYEVNYSGGAVAGWPLRFALNLRDVNIKAPTPEGGWQISQPTLNVFAPAWNLSQITLKAQGQTRYQEPGQEELTLEHAEARLILSLSHGDLAGFSLNMSEPTLFTQDATLMETADQLEINVRPGMGANDRKVDLRVDRFHGQSNPFAKPVDIRGLVQVYGWNQLVNQRDLSAFRAAGGKVRFDDIQLFAARASADVTGVLQVDDAGFAEGQLKVAFRRPGDMIKALDKSRASKEGKDALGILVLAVGNADRIALTFRFKNGGVYTGPFRLMRTRALIPAVTPAP